MASPSNPAAFNGFIASRSYVQGYQFSDADVTAFAQVAGVPSAAEHPHFFRWYSHIAAKTRSAVPVAPAAAPAAAGGKKGKKGGKKAAAKPVEDDDDFDVFGDDEEEEVSPADAAAARKAKIDAAKAAKQAKPAKVERSQVVWEVKPVDTEVDLNALAAKIRREVTMEGLVWGETHELVDVAYGIQKLLMSVVVVDELVMMDDIQEPIEAMEDEVQSVDMRTMNRL